MVSYAHGSGIGSAEQRVQGLPVTRDFYITGLGGALPIHLISHHRAKGRKQFKSDIKPLRASGKMLEYGSNSDILSSELLKLTQSIVSCIFFV